MGDLGGGVGGDLGGGGDFGGGDAFGGGDPFSDPTGFDSSMMGGGGFDSGMGLGDLIGQSQGSFGGGGGVTPSGSPWDVAQNPGAAQDQALDPGNQLPDQLQGQQGGQQPGAPQPQQPQQNDFMSWLRGLQNPNAFTPGGTAQAAESAGGDNFNSRFNAVSPGANPNVPQWANEGQTPQALQPQQNPNLADASTFDPATYAPTQQTPGPDQVTAPPASQTVIPGAPAGGDAGAMPDTTTPPDTSQPGTGGSRQGGGQGGQQDGQDGDRQGGRGDRQGGGGSPIERMLRGMGLPGSLAHLVAQAAASGMLGGGRGGGPLGRFGGMFGRGGRFGGRGFRHGLPVGGPYSHRFPGMSRMPGTMPFRPSMTGRMDPFGGRGTTGLPSGDDRGGQPGDQQPDRQPAPGDQAAPGRQDGGGQDGGQDQPDATGQLSPGPGQQDQPERDASGALVRPSEAGGPEPAPQQRPAPQAPPRPGQAPRGPYPGAGPRSNVANTLAAGGLSQNAVGGVMANIRSESGWNAGSRVADQPRFSGEAHFAHGLYQEGGSEWNNYQRWLGQKGMDWRTAWKNPVLQTQFLTENLQRNYPRVWQAMNNAQTPGEAADIFMRGYLRPARMQAMRRSLEYRRGVPSALQQLAQGGQG